MSTVAELLVESLENIGVKRVYGVVGDSLNGISHAISRNKSMEWIHVRNEEAGAFAAGAEAQLTGKLSVCAGSCGPGNVHLINGLYDCHRSGAPVLAIAAHIPRVEIGGDYFQETHPMLMYQECTCYCEQVETAEQLPRLLKIAAQAALAKRGVAMLIISGDMAMQNTKLKPLTHWQDYTRPEIVPAMTDLRKLSEAINEAQKITVFAGIGAAEARTEVLDFCEKVNAPLVHTLRGKPFMEYENAFDVGMTGLIGFSSGYYAMEDCDLLLVLGSSFPYRQFYPRKAKILQIDIEGSQLGKRADLHLGAVGDVGPTLKALLPMVREKNDRSHLDHALQHYAGARKKLDSLAEPAADDKPIHPQYLVRCIDKLASDQALFSCDVGTPTVWAARYLKMNGRRKLLGSFNHGSMANALSQSIGSQLSHPDRQVIALCGDGGFSMLMGEILTLIQHQLPIKVIVFNNGTLGFVEMEMHVAGMLDYGTELKNPDFAAMATAIGIKGIGITKSSDLEQGLAEAFAHPGPALVDVKVNRTELIMPPKLQLEQVKGFSLFLMKAIINGQGKEVIDLAENNMWRKD